MNENNYTILAEYYKNDKLMYYIVKYDDGCVKEIKGDGRNKSYDERCKNM